jgi:hypothetical protein
MPDAGEHFVVLRNPRAGEDGRRNSRSIRMEKLWWAHMLEATIERCDR